MARGRKKNPFLKKLKALDDEYQSAKETAEDGGQGRVPDGVYLLKVTGAELTASKSSGRPQVNWTFTVMSGEEKGESCYDYDGLSTETNFEFLVRRLTRLGIEPPETLAALPATLDEIMEAQPTFRGSVKTRDGFTHVYVNRLVEDMDGDDEDDEDEDKGTKKRKGKKAREPEPDDDEDEDEEDEDTDEDEDDDTDADFEDEDAIEDEDGDDDEEEVELRKGMLVEFKKGRKKLSGEILKFIDDGAQAVIDVDGKKVKADVDVLFPVEGEDDDVDDADDEEPAPPKKKAREKKRAAKREKKPRRKEKKRARGRSVRKVRR